MKTLLYSVFSTFLLLASFGSTAQRILAEMEFEAENVKSLKVKGRFCDVNLKPGEKLYCSGIIRGNGNPDNYEFTSEIRGEELFIEVVQNDNSWIRMGESTLNITVPDDVGIWVKNSSGDIEIIGLRNTTFNIESTSGDIELRDLEGDLKVVSTSGDMRIETVVGQLQTESTSGDQQIRDSNGDIITESTSGDITVSKFSGTVQVQSTSGDIEVARGVGILSLRATSGDIDGFGIELIGDSRFKANSGDIDMELINDINSISYDLQASSGSLRVGSRYSDNTIYMKQGGIWIYGVTSSGDQTYTN